MPQETKKTMGIMSRFYELVDETIAQAATKQELKEVMETFMALMREMQNVIERKMADGHTNLSGKHTQMGSEVKALEARINELVNAKVSATEASFDVKLKEMASLVGYVESMIENYDDAEIREHIETMNTKMVEVEKKMPAEFDATEIMGDIEELEKKYDELEKKLSRIGASNGGVTNMRIQQAFKYILHTEAPVGAIDGVNTTYTVSQPIFAILSLSLNGEVVAQLPNYTITGKTITFSTALPAAYSGKDWEIKYI